MLAAALSVALFYLLLTPWTTLWDRDEPRFAGAAVEMARSGQWLYPTLGGVLRAQKPILVYWLMAGAIRLFGPTELAARFWSPIALALAALFTAVAGRTLLGRRAGLVAMIVLALSPLALLEGMAATADAVLLAAITGALAAFARMVAHGPSRSRTFALAVALGLAQLTKGPAGLLLPAVTCFSALWLLRGRLPVAVLVRHVVVACVFSLGLFLVWAVPADRATGGQLLRVLLGRETLGRAIGSIDGHGVPL
jgi:4-amino-4-deoxy-L-arabinose transferase-like glycosyltransferase